MRTGKTSGFMVRQLADSAEFMLWLGQELAEETQVEAIGIKVEGD